MNFNKIKHFFLFFAIPFLLTPHLCYSDVGREITPEPVSLEHLDQIPQQYQKAVQDVTAEIKRMTRATENTCFSILESEEKNKSLIEISHFDCKKENGHYLPMVGPKIIFEYDLEKNEIASALKVYANVFNDYTYIPFIVPPKEVENLPSPYLIGAKTILADMQKNGQLSQSGCLYIFPPEKGSFLVMSDPCPKEDAKEIMIRRGGGIQYRWDINSKKFIPPATGFTQ